MVTIRFAIGLKIFAIALALLVLMSVLTSVDSYSGAPARIFEWHDNERVAA
jgi:hypothetical protein